MYRTPLGCGTAMRVFKILYLLYEAPWNLIVCVQSVWHPYGNVHQGAVQSRTAGVRKCRLHQSTSLGVLYCYAHSRNRTTIVRGTTGPPSLCT